MKHSLTMPPAPKVPEDNPIPWLTDLWSEYGCFRMDSADALASLEQKVHAGGRSAVSGSAAYEKDTLTLTSILESLRSTVAGLHTDSAVYQTAFAPIDTAGTTFSGAGKQATVVVGVKPLLDRALTNGQRAAILAGAALHETGHINDSQELVRAIDKAYPEGHPDKALANLVSNIGDDNRIEAHQMVRFSGLAPAIEVATWYFSEIQAENYRSHGFAIPHLVTLAKPEDRKTAFVAALRVPWLCDWSNAETALDVLLPLREAFRNTNDVKGHLRLVGEAIAWIKGDDTESDPDDGDGEEGEGEPSDKKSDKQGKSKSDAKSDAKGDDKSDAQPEDGEADDESDADGDDGEGDDGDAEGGDSGDDADSDSDTKGEQGDPNAEPTTDKTGTEKPPETGGMGNPDMSQTCETDAFSEGTGQAQKVADLAASEHSGSQKAMKRMRRYNGHLVRERVIERGWISLDARFATEGEEVTEKDGKAVQAVDMRVIRRSFSRLEANSQAQARNYAPNPQRSAALAAVINSSRKGTGAPERFCRTGRIDRTRLHRVSQGDVRVFQRRTAVAPQNVRAYLLLDASSSMATNGNYIKAMRAGTDLAGALEAIPWAQGKVYAHTEDEHGPFVVPLWKSGEPTSQVADYVNIPRTGTPEGFALAFVCDDLLADLRPSEKGLVMVCADGGPNDPSQVKEVADYYRRKGLRIVSISLAEALSASYQRMMYGTDVVPYHQDASVFARDLAKVIGSSI